MRLKGYKVIREEGKEEWEKKRARGRKEGWFLMREIRQKITGKHMKIKFILFSFVFQCNRRQEVHGSFSLNMK